jgi:hypothetical protein
MFRPIRQALQIVLVAGLSAGCAANLETKTVQGSDTYQKWDAQMNQMPFNFHYPDGHIESFDVHGNVWPVPLGLSKPAGERVEVYFGHFPRLPPTMCSSHLNLSGPAIDQTTPNVVASICDHDRVVVSFRDHVRPRVLVEKSEYVSRVRHVLLEGIWESAAQEPDPLPY